MKLEVRTIGEEEVPVIILDCEACGRSISLREHEIRTTIPYECEFCHHSRSLTYIEYMNITNRFAPTFLVCFVKKLRKQKLTH